MRIFIPVIIVVVCLGPIGAIAQDNSNNSEEISRISHELEITRADLAESQRQLEELRRDMEELRKQFRPPQPVLAEMSITEPTVATADQDVSFLSAKVSELHQDKVESASKYPVKISGLVLFNSYVNGGSVAADDLPVLAFPISPGSPNGSIGATLSQTLLGIEAKGPALFGARSSGDAAIDFGGGNPTTPYGVTAGLIRLRTANLHLDWENTSLNIGQDSPFFSPLSPTSYATVKEPALSWAGNLWVWTPQVEVEHRVTISPDSSLLLQSGLLDPLTEEIPFFQGRTATPGELTRVPAIGGRVALDRRSAAHYPFTIGFGGYRARQRYDAFKDIDSWTLNTDFDFSLAKSLEVSGELYKGQAVGGLGGGIWTSVVFPNSTEPHAAVHALRSTGGWAQIKVRPSARLEFNTAFGQDENYGKDLRFFSTPFTDYGFPVFQKNCAGFMNLIYKPNASLLFAIEYRRLFTAPAVGESASGDQVNLAAGVHF
jgi:hypothetical protein